MVFIVNLLSGYDEILDAAGKVDMAGL